MSTDETPTEPATLVSAAMPAAAGAEVADPTAEDRGVEDRSTTRPGTPMVGPYSVNQMDDFYVAIADGEVKATGVMNLLQRLVIAEHCRPGDRLVDVCCGRGLQLPVLWRYRPDLGHYTGLDISDTHLDEARERIAEHAEHRTASSGRSRHPRGTPVAPSDSEFPIALHRCDVAEPWPVSGPFDVAVYTSALEHLPAELGLVSLRRVAEALAPRGRLFLSTPNTPARADGNPRDLQHRVHVHERAHHELVAAIADAGLDVVDTVGILAPPLDTAGLADLVDELYGPGAGHLVRTMTRWAPPALLGPVLSTALGGHASEVLYVCQRRS